MKKTSDKPEQKSQDIVFRINRNTILTLLLSFVGILLAFNVVKANYLTARTSTPSPTPVQTPKPTSTNTPTPTPMPAQKRVVPTNNPTNTPAPTPTPQPVVQKVQYTVTQGYTTGNFYCFASSINTLPDLENQVRYRDTMYQSCTKLAQANYQSCTGKCPTPNADEIMTTYITCLEACAPLKIGTCNSEYDNLQKAKGNLSDQVHKICP